MRIRRKKHLQERLLAVSDLIFKLDIKIENVNEAIKDKSYIEYQKLFGNQNPVSLEIGCGKGGFIIEMAKLFPDRNFIAVEMLSNVLVMAVEEAVKQGLTNVKFMNCGAEYLPKYIANNSIESIYLNFSPPYPAKSYENRRLTNEKRVNEYKNYLIEGGKIYQKTDDEEFFKYSLEKFSESGFLTSDVSEELANNKVFNVMTEYEKKFRRLNMPIYSLTAQKN